MLGEVALEQVDVLSNDKRRRQTTRDIKEGGNLKKDATCKEQQLTENKRNDTNDLNSSVCEAGGAEGAACKVEDSDATRTNVDAACSELSGECAGTHSLARACSTIEEDSRHAGGCWCCAERCHGCVAEDALRTVAHRVPLRSGKERRVRRRHEELTTHNVPRCLMLCVPHEWESFNVFTFSHFDGLVFGCVLFFPK